MLGGCGLPDGGRGARLEKEPASEDGGLGIAGSRFQIFPKGHAVPWKFLGEREKQVSNYTYPKGKEEKKPNKTITEQTNLRSGPLRPLAHGNRPRGRPGSRGRRTGFEVKQIWV